MQNMNIEEICDSLDNSYEEIRRRFLEICERGSLEEFVAFENCMCRYKNCSYRIQINHILPLNFLEQGYLSLCYRGEFFIADKLKEIYPDIDDIPKRENVFYFFCAFGNLATAKIMYAKWPDICQKDIYSLFISVCEQGMLDAAKWIKEIRPEIDLYKNNNEAFVVACRRGRLDIAQWLKECCPNISHQIYNDVFINACAFGNIAIAKWIKDLPLELDRDMLNSYGRDPMIARNPEIAALFNY
jgi:hypothetical protein